MSNSYLIYCHKNHGPTFGSGYDLYIADKCNTNTNSKTSFPSTYNLEGEEKFVQNEESYETFSGAKKDGNFRVVEYEVFRLIYA